MNTGIGLKGYIDKMSTYSIYIYAYEYVVFGLKGVLIFFSFDSGVYLLSLHHLQNNAKYTFL